jgi:hypothetical protein
MQLRVLLEVRRLEVVGPEHPEVVLDQLRPLLLDDQRSGAELRIVARLVLLGDRLDRLGLDPGLRRVVDAAGEIAVSAHDDARAEKAWQVHQVPSVDSADMTNLRV